MTDNDTKTAKPTEYVILAIDGADTTAGAASQNRWMEIGTAVAVNAQAAIKSVAEGAGTFVAVPARSWKPMTRRVEQVTKDVWT
jgi:hypothetical protein